VLKDKGSVAAISAYLKFLRAHRQTLDCRRFELFPEYKMVTKYFQIDEQVLKFLCRPQVAEAFNVTTKINEPSDQGDTNRDIWKQFSHFDKIGISNMPEHISITTDGYGCCVTVGRGRSTPAEPDDNDKDNAGESSSKAVPRKRKRKPSRKRRENDKKDISKSSKGQFPLEKVTSERLVTVMTGATLIVVDPGMKPLVTAVQSDNPVHNVQLTAGHWKSARLTSTFERKEQGVDSALRLWHRLLSCQPCVATVMINGSHIFTNTMLVSRCCIHGPSSHSIADGVAVEKYGSRALWLV